MKKGTLAIAFASMVMGLSAQDYTIEKWFEGKESATVLTFDDWSPGQGSVAVPELVNRGLPASIYVTTANSFAGGGYPQMNYAAQNGIEIGNHTKNHPELATVSPSVLVDETTGAKLILDNNVPSQNGIQTLVYPKGSWNQAVIDQVKKDHIAARLFNDQRDYTFQYEFAQSENDYYKLKQIQVNNERMDAIQMAYWIDHANTNNGLMIFTFHSIGASDTWFDQISEPFFNELLDVVESKENSTWITTLSAAVKYHKEAHCATLSTLSNNSSAWVLSLTDTLSVNSTYNQALSIRLTIPQGETVSSVSQNGQAVAFSIEGNEVLFNAVPDGGDIVLDKTGLSVSISSPTSNQVFSGLNSISFSGTAVSQNGNITSVSYQVNGETIAAAGSNPYTANWTPTSYGNYTVVLTANDDLGNQNIATTSIEVEEVPSCAIPEWIPQSYTGGNSVSYGGYEYRSKWWAGSNNVPGAGDPWELIGECGDPVEENEKPTVSITGPTQTSYSTLQEIAITANAGDVDGTVAQVVFTINGTEYIDEVEPYAVAYTPTSYGVVSISAIAIDNEGEASVTANLTVQFVEPNEAPSVVLDQPLDGSIYNSLDAISFNSTATDNDGTISYVTYSVNGSDFVVANAPYAYAWTPSGAGVYAVTVVATDNDGAESTAESANITVNVPNQAPTLTITSPADGATFTNLNDITFQVSAGDDQGVSKVSYTIDQVSTDVTASPFSYVWSPSIGTYNIDVFATDAEGLTSTVESISITVEESTNTCSDPAWVNGSTYVANDLVSHNDEVWKAMWWTNSGEPGTTGEWGVWRSQGACGAPSFRKFETEALAFNLFPNPNNGTFNLQLEEAATVKIYNAQGAIVYQNKFDAGSQYLNLSVPKGVYWVTVNSAKTTEVQQVVVK